VGGAGTNNVAGGYLATVGGRTRPGGSAIVRMITACMSRPACLIAFVTTSVTTAAWHQQAPVLAGRIRRNHFVRVEVLDPGPMFNPYPRPPGTGAGSGRGLNLVDTVATAWGVEPDEAGKKVWFELRLSAG
jgi:hypothetical protein